MDFNRLVPADAYPAGDMPPYPARTLAAHVAVKGVQAGALVSLLIAPIWALTRGKGILSVIHKAQLITVPFGVVAGMAILYKKDMDGALTEDGVDDRAYRLSHNEGQKMIDKYSLIGAGAGATYGAIFGQMVLTSVLSGAVTGVALGCAAYGLEKFVLNPPVEEAPTPTTQQKLA